MIEVEGDLWEFDANVKVITTNMFVKANGDAVMGRGCAKEAARMFPWLPNKLGRHIRAHRMHDEEQPVAFLISTNPTAEDWDLWCYHVKYNWWEQASPELIRAGAEQLAEAFPPERWAAIPDGDRTWTRPMKIVLPRPGCGNGGLKWRDVRPLLQDVLDDRFYVIDYGR